MPLIPALGRQRQADLLHSQSTGLHSVFQDSIENERLFQKHKTKFRVGEMVQWLRALGASENPGLIPSYHGS